MKLSFSSTSNNYLLTSHLPLKIPGTDGLPIQLIAIFDGITIPRIPISAKPS